MYTSWFQLCKTKHGVRGGKCTKLLTEPRGRDDFYSLFMFFSVSFFSTIFILFYLLKLLSEQLNITKVITDPDSSL